MQNYKIGTRGSLLAVTQSTLMKNQLEKISGDKFELVTIKTQGDEVTNKPLWQLEGKDFFTKELDEALLRGDVDLVIHSYKDLGSVRPDGIKLAAITERKFAHDILLIPQEFVGELKKWKGDFVVGTSSPRRIVNITKSLKNYLPHGADSTYNLRCETLRGNVNSRIRKLKDGNYHAIVLALAGLERLAQTEKSAAELKELLKGLNYFILPQSVFPAAASQGALGIEVRDNRDDSGKLARIISHLAHEKTVEEVFRERKAFKEFGGGCHLAVGIHVRKIGENFLHVHSGEVDGKRIEVKYLEGISPRKTLNKLFVGLPHGKESGIIYDELIEKKPETKKLELNSGHVFVTSRYCLPTLKASMTQQNGTLWAAGTKTAELLTREGFWINGTCDSLGTEELKQFQSSLVLQIMNPSITGEWTVLTHPDSVSDMGKVIGCYSRELKEVSPDYEAKMKEVGACFWTSYPQYKIFLERFPHLKDADHFCGLGKTWQEFKAHNITITSLASMQEFYALGTT
jgi:hydroxymethylbilane synthase